MLGAASPVLLSACSSGSDSSSGGGSGAGGEVNWLTWSDHYSNDQLAKVASSTKITGRPKLFSDNADAFLQIKQTGPQFDMVSADALWVKKYMESGLIEPFDLRFDLVQLRAVLDGQELRVPQRPEGCTRIPVLVVDRADLLQPGQGQDSADIVGVADRSDVQGPDRRREHPDGPDGDRWNRRPVPSLRMRRLPTRSRRRPISWERSNRTWSSSRRRTTRS